MALATKCPHCGTIFKVAADQLKLRGGIVRCGKCGEVFDGNAALVEPDAAPQPAAAPAPAEPVPEASAEPASPVETEEVPVYTVDFDATFEPLGIIPKVEASTAEAEVQEPSAQPVPQLPIDFDLDLTPPPAAETDAERGPETELAAEQTGAQPDEQDELDEEAPEAPAPSPVDTPEYEISEPIEPEPAEPEAAGVAQEQEPVTAPVDEVPATEPDDAEGAELVPAAMAMETAHAEERAPAAEEDEADEPGFVTRVRRKEKANRILRVLMGIGSVVLLAGLLAQGVLTFGSVLAARYPQTKPALIEACKLLRCTVTLPAQIDSLAIETGELQTMGNDMFSFATVLRNDSSLAQAWPHIELALTDTANKTLVRRVITPQEYLPPRTDLRRGFAARHEQPVKVYFQLRGVTASGYHIAIFYP